MHTISKLALAAVITLFTSTAMAQADDHNAHHAAPEVVSQTLPATPASPDLSIQMSEGEVRKVNKDAKKITIRHGELRNLDMPPMTMVFQVKDPAFLEKVKEGDKVSFVAEKIGGQFTVTQIEVKQ